MLLWYEDLYKIFIEVGVCGVVVLDRYGIMGIYGMGFGYYYFCIE